MARSQPFENLKRYFGDVLSGWEPPYWIRVDGLPSNADLPSFFEIVQHGGDTETLWPSMRLIKAAKLCRLDSNLTGIDKSKLVTVKTDGRYHLFGRKRHRACRFEIAVVVAPADLKFETQVKGERFSKKPQVADGEV
ncbi:hypothetical protein GGTG_12446 [Gaeumannomyces tritici R3-111a-1]|uniref:Uncharacterized protein n=1 Tax=Gaeumannomyces tritici (strain R3-111a-1) TaxID=644352 RepID=J3PG20_GAET3|nr:hypothetical protein GGTG_12446 [Gaeumannomyces tritici R3-111a-1]EJT70273.1 hypothetical protein GGTG_12446 [Gaeumannomyces tritici R3-111a-1]